MLTFFLGPVFRLKLVGAHVGAVGKASVTKTPASIVAEDILKLVALEVAKRQEAKFHLLLLRSWPKATS